jgi:hypothetical protein
MTRLGRDKLTFVIPDELRAFGDWVEQLVAESTGKDGTGIVPVVGEPLGSAEDYGDDRIFACLSLAGDDAHRPAAIRLQAAGHPIVQLGLGDVHDLGGQFFLWEMATAVAAHRMGINPFNQPDVELAKQMARTSVDKYTRSGTLQSDLPSLRDGDLEVYGDVGAGSAREALRRFVGRGEPGDYLAVQAFLNPTAETDAALRNLRLAIRSWSGLATTVGYGPRFLHSTGQLHKGDRGRGLMLQLTADTRRDLPIPSDFLESDSVLTFGVLLAAQALGDRQALLSRDRRVLRLHLGTDPDAGIASLLR